MTSGAAKRAPSRGWMGVGLPDWRPSVAGFTCEQARCHGSAGGSTCATATITSSRSPRRTPALVTAHHRDRTTATDRGFQLGRPAARSIEIGCWEAIAITTADQPFAREAAMAGWRKSSSGIWGRRRAWNADVKQFADGMVTDHGKANDELKQSAQQTRTAGACLNPGWRGRQNQLGRVLARVTRYCRDLSSIQTTRHEVAAPLTPALGIEPRQ